MSTEINVMETKRTVQMINETKRWLFETINKTGKPLLAKLTKRGKKTEINEIRSGRRWYYSRQPWN
jgi:hypothetical protein